VAVLGVNGQAHHFGFDVLKLLDTFREGDQLGGADLRREGERE